MPKENMPKLIQDRKGLRSQITKISNNFNDDLTKIQAETELNKLNSIKVKVEKINVEIQESLWDETKTDNENVYEHELSICYEYDDKLTNAIVKYQQLLFANSKTSNDGSKSKLEVGKLHRPVAPLPKYPDKNNTPLIKFFVQFESIIDRFEYSEYEKFILLKDNLNGRPLTLINSLEIKNQSYHCAKQLLVEALANPNIQKFQTISKLLNLSCPSSKDLFVYISELRNLIEEINETKVDKDSIVQYCFLKSMPESLKNSIIQITNSNFPSVQEIMDNAFKGIERVQLSSISGAKPKCTQSKISDYSTDNENLYDGPHLTNTYAANVVTDKKFTTNINKNTYNKSPGNFMKLSGII